MLVNGGLDCPNTDFLKELKQSTLDDNSKNLMRATVRQMDLTARAYHRVLKLSRTLADLAGEEAIQAPHLAEALQYRPRNVI